MSFGFSYVGLIFLLLLFVPNFFWTKHKPAGYDGYAANENRVLLALERTGEAAVCCLVLIFEDFNYQGLSPWLIWLFDAAFCMILYEVFWIRYFLSEKTMRDFYSRLLVFPVAGASLPVTAVLLLAVYGKNPLLFAAGVILGIGHIGIHLGHKKEAEREEKAEKARKERKDTQKQRPGKEKADG